MGIFSKHHRFREAGQAANVNNVAEFGKPVKSLFTSTKVLSLRHHIDITDDHEQVVYESNSKVISIRDKTDITDAAGRHVAHIESKIFSLHERHFITMADGLKFEMSNEIFHLVKDITNIEGLGWQLRGNILGLNFQLYDSHGRIIAVISQKMLSLHDKYCIDIYMPEHEKIVIAILITLQHMMVDRAVSSSASSGSSNN
ncbi:MAG: LURP-one-related family protein [Blautia sp.]|nr:LURP-one-related family protein [Blautia sp.]